MVVVIVLRGRRLLDFWSLVVGLWFYNRLLILIRLCEFFKVLISGFKIYEMCMYYVKFKVFGKGKKLLIIIILVLKVDKCKYWSYEG